MVWALSAMGFEPLVLQKAFKKSDPVELTFFTNDPVKLKKTGCFRKKLKFAGSPLPSMELEKVPVTKKARFVVTKRKAKGECANSYA